MTAIELEGLTKDYGEVLANDDVLVAMTLVALPATQAWFGRVDVD